MTTDRFLTDVLADADLNRQERLAAKGYRFVVRVSHRFIETFGIEPRRNSDGAYSWPTPMCPRFGVKRGALEDRLYGIKARRVVEADAAAIAAVDAEIADLGKALKALRAERLSLCERALARGKPVRVSSFNEEAAR